MWQQFKVSQEEVATEAIKLHRLHTLRGRLQLHSLKGVSRGRLQFAHAPLHRHLFLIAIFLVASSTSTIHPSVSISFSLLAARSYRHQHLCRIIGITLEMHKITELCVTPEFNERTAPILSQNSIFSLSFFRVWFFSFCPSQSLYLTVFISPLSSQVIELCMQDKYFTHYHYSWGRFSRL